MRREKNRERKLQNREADKKVYFEMQYPTLLAEKKILKNFPHSKTNKHQQRKGIQAHEQTTKWQNIRICMQLQDRLFSQETKHYNK